MWVCPNCGEELSDKDVTFCGVCGSRIAEAEEVETVNDGFGFNEEPAVEVETADDAACWSASSQDSPEPPNEFWYASDAYNSVDDGEYDAELEDEAGEAFEREPEDLEPNLIPEDLSTLTQKLDDMVESGAFTAQAREIVLLKQFESTSEALIVKGLLDCEGIPSMTSMSNLFVCQDDLEQAKQIIGEQG